MHVVTGGAGFLGSALVWQLNGRGIEDIIVVDNLANSEKWRNLAHCKYVDYIHRDKFIEMIRKDDLPFALHSITHLGACSSTTETNADFLMENNFHYSQDVCRYALEKGARFINASSAATYGAGEWGFSDNVKLLDKLLPLNMYGYSKQLFDLWLKRENLLAEAASLKFFNVYGPNEYHKGDMASVASKLFAEISKSGHATLFASNREGIADGEQKRDFVYVKDCAKLMAWLLLDAPQVNGVKNVGTGNAETFNNVAKAVFDAMGMEADIRYREMPAELQKKYQNYTCADMSWLGDCPIKFANVKAGVHDYVKNYLQSSDPYLSSLH